MKYHKDDTFIRKTSLLNSMDQILFATGLYGLFGSVLIVIFHFLPEIVEVHSKGNLKFFADKDEKELNQSKKTYDFYAHLWSFRLISTGFIIMILYSISPERYLNLPYNIIFVVLDSVILSLVATCGIEGVHKNSIELRTEYLIGFYLGLSSIVYFLLISINFSYYDSTKVDFIDNLLLISTLVSQWIFVPLVHLRYKLVKLNESL